MFKYLKGKNATASETITNVKELGISATENIKLTKQKTEYLAHVFHLLGDMTRLKIMLMLAKQRLCVSDISHKTGFSVSLVSHNLRLLKTAGLVKSKRDGKKIYYTIDADAVEIIKPIALTIQNT